MTTPPRRSPFARRLAPAAVLIVLAAIGARTALSNHPGAAATRKIEIDHFSLSHVYSSWGELKGSSPLVVIGTTGIPQPAHPQFEGHHVASEVWTQTPLVIDTTVLGDAPRSLSVLQSGQPSTSTLSVESDFPILSPGTRYMLFLTPSPIPGQWYPVGAPQGVFPITADAKANMYTNIGIPVHDLPLKQLIDTVQAVAATPLQQ